MLELTLESTEFYDQKKQEFVDVYDEITVKMEHSLISIHKWESLYKKPFLMTKNKTREESVAYAWCMLIKPIPIERLSVQLTTRHMQLITDYIDDSMTAVKFRDKQKGRNTDRITAELIYYWMISMQIPVEFEKWHLNQLLALIEVCSAKNSKDKTKKRSQKELLNEQARINEINRARFNSKG